MPNGSCAEIAKILQKLVNLLIRMDEADIGAARELRLSMDHFILLQSQDNKNISIFGTRQVHSHHHSLME